MTPEVGDKFIINWKGITKSYPNIRVCNFPHLEFTVEHFSKSGLSVYYFDKRTNKKCHCQYCLIKNIKHSIGVNDIIIRI
jgi:hypothetical protein